MRSDIAALMLASPPGPSRVTVAAVIRACALHYGIAPGLFTEPDGGAGQRQMWISRKRQVAMYLCRELTETSTPQIGHYFGHRHHTTVLHACDAVKQRLSSDDFTCADVRAVMKILGAIEMVAKL